MLLLLATLYVPAPALAATCSGHTDANSYDCTFSCQENDQVSVSVTADDQDEWTPARAIGSASCGNVNASCNEERTCGDTADETTTAAQTDGACHAETDEIWHDGFNWECKAVHLCAPPCGDDDLKKVIEKVANQLCALVPWACTPTDAVGYAGTAADGALAYAEHYTARCGFTYEAMVTPSTEWAQREILKTRSGAEDCAGLTANVDPATGLPANVRSQVRVSVKGDQALGEVCNAGIGCWFVLPVCERNAAGLIRGCIVDGSSLTVQPSENLKTLLGF